MARYIIGKIIRTQRELQSITQEALCDGICDVSTLSKIENNRQQPRRVTLIALLQRLGLCADKYYGLGNMEELELESLKLEIKNANSQDNYYQALVLLSELESNYDTSDDPITKQFILWSHAINGCLQDKKVIPYAPQEQRELLLKAIAYTVPRFSLDNISQLLLSLDEIITIENIANSYSNEEDYKKSNLLHAQLLKYVQQHLLPISEGALIIPLIAYNYSRSLGRDHLDAECLRIAQIGIDCCIDYGKSRLFGELLINKAYALHRLGKEPEGMRAAIQSYHVLSAMAATHDAQIVKQYLIDTYSFYPA